LATQLELSEPETDHDDTENEHNEGDRKGEKGAFRGDPFNSDENSSSVESISGRVKAKWDSGLSHNRYFKFQNLKFILHAGSHIIGTLKFRIYEAKI
jgi:hypothetical protein